MYCPRRYGENSPQPFDVGNAPWDPSDPFRSIAAFIATLREELCVKRNKTVVFRTWDTSAHTLHSNASYYEEVTHRVPPHPKLVFSIKHTALDFWRTSCTLCHSFVRVGLLLRQHLLRPQRL